MTEFIIRYYKYNKELGECEVKLPNDTVNEFIRHLKKLFEVELLQGQILKGKEQTNIKFQASKHKIRQLEEIIKLALSCTARLN